MAFARLLLAFGARQIVEVSADKVVGAILSHLSDRGQVLLKALAKANDRAWHAVGLSLAGDGIFDRLKDPFRDGTMKGVRDQIKQFLQETPCGFDDTPAAFRAKAAEEWQRLRKDQRLFAEAVTPEQIAQSAGAMQRYGDQARTTATATDAVRQIAEALRPEAPHLASLLTASPPGGTPLLVAAFSFFLRREIETDPELARGLSFDYLRAISERQERGLELLDHRTNGIVDKLDTLFDEMSRFFESLGSNVEEIRQTLDGYTGTMEKLRDFLNRNDVPKSSSRPTNVTVGSSEELERLRLIRDGLRQLPPEMLTTTDWTRLGEALRSAGLFSDAAASDRAAVAAAKKIEDTAAEAAAEYNRYKDACETGEWEMATAALRRAVALKRDDYQPFDWARYELIGILGVGGFGSVFHCLDRFEIDDATDEPASVAIKTLHNDGLDRTIQDVFREARTLKKLRHPWIVGIRDQDFACKIDALAPRRPYFVLEYFPGPTLESYLAKVKTIPVADLLRLAHKIAVAVHEAHKAGVLHRDLKPANILVQPLPGGDWDIRVIDFGLAVKLRATTASISIPSDRKASQDKSFAGTLQYASPEQMGQLAGVAVGPYSDVYAFGKTCIECLFGHSQAQDDDWEELPEEYRAGARKLFNRCVRYPLDGKNPRFADFAPVIEGLAEMVGGKPPVPPKPVSKEAAPIPTLFTRVPEVIQLPTLAPGPAPSVPPTIAKSPPVQAREAPSNQPPANPKAGDLFAMRITIPEPTRKPGEIMVLRIST